MGNSLSDTSLHLWSIAAKKLEIGSYNSYGVCGVHIGRFTSKPEEVTCVNCLSIINSKGSNGPKATG